MSREYTSGARPIYRNSIEDHPSMISIISAKMCARIMIEDIEYIEQEGRQLHIFTSDTDYVVYENINMMVEAVRYKDSFFRSLKTIIVNFNRITKMEDEYIYFESGRCITLGRNSFCRTRNAFKKHIMRYQIMTETMRESRVAEKI